MVTKPWNYFVIECEYDSTWKTDGLVTLGGRKTTDEMCMTFLSYYPKVDGLLACTSEVKEKTMLKFFGIESISL